jgi:hypothetical protein
VIRWKGGGNGVGYLYIQHCNIIISLHLL